MFACSHINVRVPDALTHNVREYASLALFYQGTSGTRKMRYIRNGTVLELSTEFLTLHSRKRISLFEGEN